MNDDQFIRILKAKLKQYYQEGRSVGLELRELVANFRQEIEDDCMKIKYQEPKEKPKSIFKKNFKTSLNGNTKTTDDNPFNS